jgi:hypothetical protein
MSGPSSGDRDRLAAWAANEERHRLEGEARVRHATFDDAPDDRRRPGWMELIVSRIRRVLGR